MGVPVITVDGQAVVGFDVRRLEQLLSQASPKRPSLGISIADASKMAMKAGSIPVFGALIGKVRPGSPGERAGLQPGDIVTEANLRVISNAADLEGVLKSLPAGSRLVLGITRGPRKLSVTAQL